MSLIDKLNMEREIVFLDYSGLMSFDWILMSLI